MTLPFIQDNASSRRKLEALLPTLTGADLALTTSYGWTVSALLAHLAFWDMRMVVLLRRWKTQGLDESPMDSEMTNESMKPLCHALDPHAAVRLCLECMAACDAEIETTTPELVAAIEASPTHFRFNRSLHRGDHIRDVEELLKQRSG